MFSDFHGAEVSAGKWFEIISARLDFFMITED
jgi:hypothetical protein